MNGQSFNSHRALRSHIATSPECKWKKHNDVAQGPSASFQTTCSAVMSNLDHDGTTQMVDPCDVGGLGIQNSSPDGGTSGPGTEGILQSLVSEVSPTTVYNRSDFDNAAGTDLDCETGSNLEAQSEADDLDEEYETTSSIEGIDEHSLDDEMNDPEFEHEDSITNPRKSNRSNFRCLSAL